MAAVDVEKPPRICQAPGCEKDLDALGKRPQAKTCSGPCRAEKSRHDRGLASGSNGAGERVRSDTTGEPHRNRTSQRKRRISRSIRITLPDEIGVQLYPDAKDLSEVSPSKATQMFYERLTAALTRKGLMQ